MLEMRKDNAVNSAPDTIPAMGRRRECPGPARRIPALRFLRPGGLPRSGALRSGAKRQNPKRQRRLYAKGGSNQQNEALEMVRARVTHNG